MNNGFYEFSRGGQETTSSVFPYTGSAIITGSLQVVGTTTINNIILLTPTATTPDTPTNGMVIVSGSGANQHIYCYLDQKWAQLD